MDVFVTASKYSVGEKLHHGALVSVYRGARVEDGLPVVLKRLERPRPNSSDVPRFRHEYALARALESPGVVEMLELYEGRDGPTLVMRDHGGRSLDRLLRDERPTLLESLRIAASAAAALGSVHARDVIHKDVTPANIVWNRATGVVELIDFGIAAELARETASAGAQAFEGTLAYIAPEQTGRMNRSIDWRADFYGLGATLYELLTGRVPFEGEDTLAVVHGHIARPPVPPHSLDPSIPQTVSALVLKLLAKDPEDRYQSAHGLVADLGACIAALEAGQPVPAFPLGREDRSERFRIPERLYGREEQAARLLTAYERVCVGHAELLLVAGQPGIGKSALVHEVHKPMAAKRGHLVEGKFDQFNRSVPFAALIQAFDQLARRLLAEPEAVLAERRAALAQAVGGNGALITELIPAFALILGDQPAAPRLGPAESELRFQLTFQNFVMALATPDRPLVLFLDDLQWADRPSLDLLAKLVGDPEMRHLLVIGAYRDGEVPTGHPLNKAVEAVLVAGGAVETMTIGPLDADAVCGLVAETLRVDEAEARPLAEICRAKTEGNPFFLAQFLLSLHQDGLIGFDRAAGAWRWDREAVSGHASTANVVELMVAKLQRLPEATQRALSVAACVGNRFDLNTLSVAADLPPATLVAALWPALREELVVPVDAAYRYMAQVSAQIPGDPSEDETAKATLAAGYRFLHDRVQQAAYALIPEAERAATHRTIGRLMLARADAATRHERLFDILGHINRGRALIGDEAERRAVARLNLEAARRAVESAAFEPAVAYAETGIALLGEDGWTGEYVLMLDLHEVALQAASVGSDYAKVDELAGLVTRRARTPTDAARTQVLHMSSLMARGDLVGAIDIGYAAARMLNIRLLKQRGPLGGVKLLLQGWWAMLRHDHLPPPPPKDAVLAHWTSEVLSVLLTAAFVAKRELWLPNAIRHIQAGLARGTPMELASAYTGWLTLMSVVGKHKSAVAWTRRVVDLAAAGISHQKMPRAMYFCLYFGRHWTEPMAAVRAAFMETYDNSLAVGDGESAGYALSSWLRLGWHMGVDLSRLETEAQDAQRRFVRIGSNFYGPQVSVVSQMVENLRRGAPAKDVAQNFAPWRFTGRHVDEDKVLADYRASGNSVSTNVVLLLKLQVARLFGQVEECRAVLEAMAPTARIMNGTYQQAILLFERALVDGMGPLPTRAERRKAAKRIAPAVRWFRKVAAIGPANHRHRLLLVEAEWLRLRDRPAEAAQTYDLAIAAALEAGFIQDAATAAERAADFFAERGRDALARFYRTQARDTYRRWEAWAKVADMERRHPDIAPAPVMVRGTAQTAGSTDRLTGSALDVEAVFKAAEVISGEIHREALLEKMLRTVFEVAGAQRGNLLLTGPDGQLLLAAEGDAAADRFAALPGLSPDAPAEDATADGGPRLPATVVAYAARVQEPVVLSDAARDPRFSEDPYIKARVPKSLLCLPLLRQGALVGVLYLENNLATNAFVDQRLEAPRLLTAQIAISLENARLYDELADFSRSLEAQVADRTRALSEQSEVLRGTLDEVRAAHVQLQETQEQLVQAEKMAALGQLVAGVAHEINTPLGVALTTASHIADETGRMRETVRNGKLKRSDFENYADAMQETAGLLLSNLARAADLVQGFKQVAADQTSDERRLFTLDDWIGDLVASLRPMWHKPGHTLSVDCPEGILLDNYPGALAQILTNLVSNSLVHGYGPEQTGQLRIAVGEPDPDSVELVYTDDGLGIAPENLPTIFDPFFTTRRAQGSTGLGLHIVYNLVAQRLGGTIKVGSALGSGVRFTLRFPKVAP